MEACNQIQRMLPMPTHPIDPARIVENVRMALRVRDEHAKDLHAAVSSIRELNRNLEKRASLSGC